MMNADDLVDQQIERYIHNLMDAAERMLFEKQIQEDAALKKEVEELIELKNNFDPGLFDFKKNLSAAKEELEQEGFFEENIKDDKVAAKGFSLKRNFWWAAAASVILIAGVFYFYNREPDYQQLAMNAALNDFSQLRGTMDELDSLFYAGAYSSYIKKAQHMINDSVINKENEKLLINIGRCYILMGKPENVMHLMEKYSATIEKSCRLQFVKAIAVLQLKQKGNAVQLLKKIDCYPEEVYAKELLQNL